MTADIHEDHQGSQPLALGSTEGLGPLVDVLARWEDQNGTMAAVLPSEWDSLRQEVMDACVIQSPRMLRNQVLWLRAENAELRTMLTRYRLEVPLGNQPHMLAHAVDVVIGRA